MMKPNLVLAFCSNYDFEQVEPFIASLLHVGGNTEIVFFASNMSETFDLICERRNIGVLDATLYAKQKYHIQNGRFFMYRDFMEENSQKYSQILLTDVRDVFFQGDPFNVALERDVCFAAEDTTIRFCPHNSLWLKEIYGEALFDELADNQISCSGTTLGTAAAMKQYVDDMCEEIAGHEYDHSRPNDQGMHNYIVWKRRPQYGALDTEDRVINTVGYTDKKQITLQDDMVFVDRTFSPIIHQWDRHEMLQRHVNASSRFRIF